MKKIWSVGRRNFFFFFFFFYIYIYISIFFSPEVVRACNCMKIQVFCLGSVLYFFIFTFLLIKIAESGV